MRCSKHNKEITGVCTWCGREMCKLCISKTDGNKKYCSHCVGSIGDMIKQRQIDKIKEEEKKEPKRAGSGYFSFDSLKIK